MRAGIEHWLLKHWYGGHTPPWYLRMAEPLYRAAYQRDQKKSAATIYKPRLPLIVVGNITAGGSGKTPLVIRLCELATEMQLRPGVASTGYGRQGSATIEVKADSDVKVSGDEPLMLAQRTGVPVVVARNRADAVAMLNDMDIDLVFSDDGLQQAGLQRDVDICVIDGERGLGNGHLVPAGPLREAAGRLQCVDYVVSNGEWPGKPDGLAVIVMELQALTVRSLDGDSQYPMAEFLQSHRGKSFHAIAAIGNPQRFFNMLRDLGLQLAEHRFSDHHAFSAEDFASIPAGGAIIMTEKDAVKCRGLGLKNAWYVPVETRLPDAFEQAFKQRLVQLVKNRR